MRHIVYLSTFFKVACAMAPEDVNTILKYHNITELDGKEPFFMATDNQVPSVSICVLFFFRNGIIFL